MPFNLGFGEILIVLVLALLLFGGRLPEVGRSLGRSLKEFKEGLNDSSPSHQEEEVEAEDVTETKALAEPKESAETLSPDPEAPEAVTAAPSKNGADSAQNTGS